MMNFENSDIGNLARIGLQLIKRQEVLTDAVTAALLRTRRLEHPNPFTRYGGKVFSQNDEDGLIFEICRRLGLENGRFCEFGVGNGTENNTFALLAAGWTGVWFGGEDIVFDPAGSRLEFIKEWITKENIVSLLEGYFEKSSIPKVDLISLDLDGNDFYLIEEMLTSGIHPNIFICEYNARFAPPINFKIDYNEKHVWQGDDYFGASLASLNDLFEKFGYFLVCCNAATGCNAFFVDKSFKGLFPEVPDSIDRIYAEPMYLPYKLFAHPISKRTIESLIR